MNYCPFCGEIATRDSPRELTPVPLSKDETVYVHSDCLEDFGEPVANTKETWLTTQ